MCSLSGTWTSGQEWEENQNLTGEHRSSLTETELAEEFTFYFRCNKSSIDEGYMTNGQEAEILRGMLGRTGFRVDTLTIYAYSSPEGPKKFNSALSLRRAESVRRFIQANSSKAPNNIIVVQKEENWPGLRQTVRQSYRRDNREEVLRILSEESDDEARKKALRALDGGESYRYIIDTLMAPLRNATFRIRWERLQSRGEDPVALAALALPAQTYALTMPTFQPQQATEIIPEPEYAKRTIIALKTNALYDAFTALNYSIEVPIGKRFSIAWQHYFPWWHTRKDLDLCLQYLTLGAEARWWFAPRPKPETDKRQIRDVLTGHFLGLYGLWGKADVQVKRTIGNYQCANIFSVGLTYGYSMPMSRHWNVEFSISVGYARIPYQHYIPSDDWQILWRDPENAGVLHWFGPTNVAISFIRPIAINYRKK